MLMFGHHEGYIVHSLIFFGFATSPMCRGFRERNKNISLYLLGWEFSDTVMVRLFSAFVYHETPGNRSILSILRLHMCISLANRGRLVLHKLLTTFKYGPDSDREWNILCLGFFKEGK